MEPQEASKQLEKCVRAFVAHVEEIAWDSLGTAWSDSERCCKSPIEQIFFMAWLMQLERYRIFGASIGGTARLEIRDGNDNADKWDMAGIEQLDILIPQHTIENYRADFLIRRVEHEHASGADVASPKLVVECDGHDFHEKTKHQAAHDKRRDRTLVRGGYTIMRFTGWELHNNPDKCAEEVDDFLADAICQLHKDARKRSKIDKQTNGCG